ncbi:MAG: glycosyltransferase [Patescibacteria group bacterium]
MNIIMIGMTAQGKGISGCDRIATEFAKRWARLYPVTIYVWEEGYEMYKRQSLSSKDVTFMVIKMSPWKYLGFVINYVAVILSAILFSLTTKLKNEKDTVVYSASEFWMDSLPAVIWKLRFPKITWVATWFQTAPNPLVGFKEGERVLSYRLHAFLYWFVQLPIKPLIKKFADFVLVNNEDERKQFPDMEKSGKVIVVLGAVDFKQIGNWIRKESGGKLPKIYDGVFQGRFHPQKGVVELINIWKLVVDQKSDAKLALIGDGPLMSNVKKRIDKLNLQKNIVLFGYVFDGEKKYKIFAQSKVVLHPAFYDSGGMASAEAMAFGLPAVGFNLISYKSYYPKGMVKVPINDMEAFAEEILNLLRDKKAYSKIGNQAKSMITQNWSWDKRANEVLSYIT